MKTHGFFESDERHPFRSGHSQITIFKTIIMNAEAELAADLARHIAIVAAEPDGDDSSGRQKLRLLSCAEVAARACDIAQEMFSQFATREWLVKIPAPRALNNASGDE